MNTTEQWVTDWINWPKEELQFPSKEEAHEMAHGQIHPLFKQELPSQREFVAPALLHQLHQHLRGNGVYEWRVWNELFLHLIPPLPDEIAHDLIDRDISIVILGHTRQSDVILRRLAPLVDEALLTLIWGIYKNPERPLEEFVELLDAFPGHQWMYTRLAHGVASSPEKEAALLKHVEGTPNWDLVHASRESYQQRLHEQQEYEKRLERARISTDAEELQALSESEEIEILVALARNQELPLEVLTELSQMKGSSKLRHESKNELHRRREKQRRDEINRLRNSD